MFDYPERSPICAKFPPFLQNSRAESGALHNTMISMWTISPSFLPQLTNIPILRGALRRWRSIGNYSSRKIWPQATQPDINSTLHCKGPTQGSKSRDALWCFHLVSSHQFLISFYFPHWFMDHYFKILTFAKKELIFLSCQCYILWYYSSEYIMYLKQPKITSYFYYKFCFPFQSKLGLEKFWFGKLQNMHIIKRCLKVSSSRSIPEN